MNVRKSLNSHEHQFPYLQHWNNNVLLLFKYAMHVKFLSKFPINSRYYKVFLSLVLKDYFYNPGCSNTGFEDSETSKTKTLLPHTRFLANRLFYSTAHGQTQRQTHRLKGVRLTLFTHLGMFFSPQNPDTQLGVHLM